MEQHINGFWAIKIFFQHEMKYQFGVNQKMPPFSK